MGIGVSVFLLAVGAVLSFGVHSNVPHTNLDTVGVILMIAGGIGLLVALAFAAAGRRRPVATRERVVERGTSHPARGGTN
jgi:hypothetical protein